MNNKVESVSSMCAFSPTVWCWMLDSTKLKSFHHRCIRIILSISNHEQWTKSITMHEIRRKWGDDDTAEIKIAKRRLQWLGHLARMPDHRLPKVALFSWLSEPRPRCGLIKRWRDAVWNDLRVIEEWNCWWHKNNCVIRFNTEYNNYVIEDIQFLYITLSLSLSNHLFIFYNSFDCGAVHIRHVVRFGECFITKRYVDM